MRRTLKDVAEKAGVSRSAVSRAFTEGASVSPEMRRKVMKAAHELGYSPNALASSLTTGRTKLVGLVSNNFRNPFFLEVFDLFTRGLQDAGLRPLLVNLSDETEPRDSLRMMQQYSVDGVILASSTLPVGFPRAFRDAGMPIVHAFGRFSGRPQVHVVGIDNVEAGRMAARTLAARGYRRVTFLAGPETATTTQDRLQGFREEMALHPEIETDVAFGAAYSFVAGRTAMLELIKRPMAEAYFCGDDVLSIGALSALRENGIRVPEDVGIIGVNDMEMSSWELINLTTIRQPIRPMIRSAVDLMANILYDEDAVPEARLFSCDIVERGTLRPCPKD